jgi:hypothetical protein
MSWADNQTTPTTTHFISDIFTVGYGCTKLLVRPDFRPERKNRGIFPCSLIIKIFNGRPLRVKFLSLNVNYVDSIARSSLLRRNAGSDHDLSAEPRFPHHLLDNSKDSLGLLNAFDG